ASETEKQKIGRREPGNDDDDDDDDDDELGGEGGDGARGYQRVGENVTEGRRDWHEAVDFYREFDTDATTDGGSKGRKRSYELLRGPNLWPAQPEELRQVFEAYIEDVETVGTAVVRAMGMALGLEGEDAEVFVEATRRSFWVMRMIGYPPLQDGGEEGVSCGEHTDYGCVTLLLADETKGALKVQRKSGEWVDADPVEGAFVVNVGDMMERWTNGLWKSTRHRVVHRGGGYRVSVPFFFEPDFDAVVRPLEKCVKETGGKVKYEEVVYGEHLIAKIKGNFY
ncbi:hypothetical protein LTS18_013393, partial [Coniosporium uncinatum]